MLDFHYVITIYRLRAMVAMNILRRLTGGIFLGHPVYDLILNMKTMQHRALIYKRPDATYSRICSHQGMLNNTVTSTQEMRWDRRTRTTRREGSFVLLLIDTRLTPHSAQQHQSEGALYCSTI